MMTEAQLLDVCKKYADKAGFRLNPDQEMVNIVIKGILENEKKYGYKYCPCRMVTGDKEKDRAIICPCSYHKAEIKEQGYCHCMLYFSKE